MRNYTYLVLLLLILLPLTSAVLFNNPNLPKYSTPITSSGSGNITIYNNYTYINQTGGSNDGNNYTEGIFISGGSTKNITLSRQGMGNISAIFTDNVGTDTDTYLTSVTATNGSEHLFNFSVPGQTPIYVSIDDLDSWAGNISFYYTKTESDNKYLLISNWNATNTSYYLASNPNGYISSYTETDPYWTGNKSTYDDNNISMGNYVRYVNGTCSAYTDAKLGLYYLASNPSGYITSSALSPYLLISNWNATNTSYYLASNPNGYISSYTETDPKWTANYTAYNASWSLDTDTNNYLTGVTATNDTGQHIFTFSRSGLADLKVAINDQTGTGSGGLNAWVNSTNTTTYNRTGSATDLIISELNATLKAGSYYVVNCMIGYKTAVATTGITWNMSFSTGVLSQTLVAEFPASATTISTVTSTTTGYAGFNATGSGGVNNLGFLKISGGIRTAGTDVSVVHKFKSELASPQWTWVNGDSWCQYTKMY